MSRDSVDNLAPFEGLFTCETMADDYPGSKSKDLGLKKAQGVRLLRRLA